MGTDIAGWVEVRARYGQHETWHGVIVIASLLPRDYDSFGCLFGVRNSANFAPVAAERGLPPALSVEARQAILEQPFDEAACRSTAEVAAALEASGAHSPSWLTLDEIRAIDLDEPARGVDDRVSKYRREEDGTLTLVSKAAWDADFAQLSSVTLDRVLAADLGRQARPRWEEGQTWEGGAFVFTAERATRRAALESWELVFRLMEALGEQYGPDGVRVVVWFG